MIVPSAHIQNVLNCVEKAGIEVLGLVIKPLASALGVLSNEEAIAGAVLVDVGGGTSGVAIFADGRPKHLAIIPVGGDHITNDVATVMKIPLNKAEDLKKEVAFCYENDNQNNYEFDHMGRNYVCDMQDLTDVVQCRIEELFHVLVQAEIEKAGLPMLPAGIVITGGVSKTNGIDKYLSQVMDMQVRVALPLDSSKMPPGRNGPEYACAAGIIRYALERERDNYRYMEPWAQTLKNQGRYPMNVPDRSPRLSPAGPDDTQGSIGGITGFIDFIKRMFREIF